MPPVTKAGGSAFRKDVDFVAKDADEQVATGIVMVPDKADLQHDFAREDTIRGFADQFETFAEAGQAGGGIMHAVWPDGWMALERNEVLDEAEEIGGQTVEPGAWVQSWSVNNADLWSLIDEGILEGYSIGAIQVDWNGPFERDEVDDVAVPDDLPDDAMIWELTDGIIREVSAVDIPAVPDAEILEAKGLDKRLAEHVGNPDAFIEEAMDRGHSEAEAEQLWDVLNEAMEADGASEPGKQSVLHRAGKAFLSALGGSDDGNDTTSSPEAPDSESPATHKEGRTLSAANRERAMAAIDANLDVLHDAGVDDLPKRFTDRGSVDFDLTEHAAATWEGDHPDDGDGEGESEDEDPDDETEEAATTEDASGGDTSDSTTNMSDTDDPWDDAPEWAKDLRDDVKENSQRIDKQNDRIEAALESTGEDKTAEIEIDGQVYEVSKSEVESWFDDSGDGDDAMADAPDHIKALADEIEAVNNRINRISQQTGGSQQLEAAAGNSDGDGSGDKDGLEGLGKALS